MSNVITPDVAQFGGGIEKDQVGARTAKYVDYFAEDASKDGTQLTAKRLANYQDVVNSCAWPCSTRSAALAVALGARPRVRERSLQTWGRRRVCPCSRATTPLARLRPGHLLLRVRLVRSHPRRGEEAGTRRLGVTRWSAPASRHRFNSPPLHCPFLPPGECPLRCSWHVHDTRCAGLCRGDSFHFAHRFRDESLKESIRRHEYFLALKLHLTKADKASCQPAHLCGCDMPRERRCVAAGGLFSVPTLNRCWTWAAASGAPCAPSAGSAAPVWSG